LRNRYKKLNKFKTESLPVSPANSLFDTLVKILLGNADE